MQGASLSSLPVKKGIKLTLSIFLFTNVYLYNFSYCLYSLFLSFLANESIDQFTNKLIHRLANFPIFQLRKKS